MSLLCTMYLKMTESFAPIAVHVTRSQHACHKSFHGIATCDKPHKRVLLGPPVPALSHHITITVAVWVLYGVQSLWVVEYSFARHVCNHVANLLVEVPGALLASHNSIFLAVGGNNRRVVGLRGVVLRSLASFGTGTRQLAVDVQLYHATCQPALATSRCEVKSKYCIRNVNVPHDLLPSSMKAKVGLISISPLSARAC